EPGGPGAAPERGARADRSARGSGVRAAPAMADERGGQVIRKREPRWQSAAERARVAAELIEEAESLTETSTIATPADVRRASLPPPIHAELPPELRPELPIAPAPPPPAVPPTLDGALAADPENVGLLVERARRLAAARHYTAA